MVISTWTFAIPLRVPRSDARRTVAVTSLPSPRCTRAFLMIPVGSNWSARPSTISAAPPNPYTGPAHQSSPSPSRTAPSDHEAISYQRPIRTKTAPSSRALARYPGDIKRGSPLRARASVFRPTIATKTLPEPRGYDAAGPFQLSQSMWNTFGSTRSTSTFRVDPGIRSASLARSITILSLTS